MTGPEVIIVAEPEIGALLRDSGIDWRLQERQSSIAGMWEGLSSGALSAHSRILVFSDSLEPHAEQATAQAIAAMANARAHVFVAVWQSDRVDALRERIDREAATIGAAPGMLPVHYLPVESGPREVLECIRTVLGTEIEWPDEYPAEVDAAFGIPVADVETIEPAAPLPSGACAELLAQPPVPGQVTITVTSSKGGSGKSTAALLLAASIARASREGGDPLSVCVVDMDTRDGQVASLIGKYMPTALNIRVQPVWDELTIRRHLVYEEALGVHALLAPIRPRTADTVGPEFYRTIIRSLQRMFDVVVMDTSVQYLDPLIAKVCLPEATEVLFITTLASTAVQGMARALREITAPIEESGLGISRDKIGIIVNQSVAGVGMQREQILAAGLGVPVVGVIPLATKDVLSATNMHRMHTLLDHPLIGPAYNELARTCLPGRELAEFNAGADEQAAAIQEISLPVAAQVDAEPAMSGARRRGLFRRE